MKFKVGIIDSRNDPYIVDDSLERKLLSDIAEITVVKVDCHSELVGLVEEFDAVISWHLVPLPQAVIKMLKKCKFIVRAAVGFDNIDVDYAASRGIKVYTIPDYGTEEVADHTVCLILALARKITASDRATRNGFWDWRALGNMQRVRGLKIGIIGFGRIGCAVGKRAAVFGMDVGFFDPYLKDGVDKSLGVYRYEKMELLLEDADIISLHAPLNDETRKFIGDKEFKLMKSGVVLINTARGGLIDQKCLLEALQDGTIGGLGCDVLESEPEIPLELTTSESVILTPHSAFFSNQSLHELKEKSALAIRKLLIGEVVRSCVN